MFQIWFILVDSRNVLDKKSGISLECCILNDQVIKSLYSKINSLTTEKTKGNSENSPKFSRTYDHHSCCVMEPSGLFPTFTI